MDKAIENIRELRNNSAKIVQLQRINTTNEVELKNLKNEIDRIKTKLDAIEILLNKIVKAFD